MSGTVIAPGMGPRPSILAALEREEVVWLSSVRPDGRPHVVPLWFVWDGTDLLVFSKPTAQKVRNMRANPRVMVAVGKPGLEFDVELVEATAELPDSPSNELLPAAFEAKYGASLARLEIDHERFARIYSQPIRLRPRRWLDWGGPSWQRRSPAIADSRTHEASEEFAA